MKNVTFFRKQYLSRFLLFILALFAFWPTSVCCQEQLTIPGTGDSQVLLRLLAASFEKSHPDVRVEIPDSIGSSGGIRLVETGKALLARVARPLKDREKVKGLQYRVFAYSPVVFITHPDIGELNNLTSTEVLGIFSGRISRWEELGGRPGPILVANREPGDSSRTWLEKYFPGFAVSKVSVGKIIYSTPEILATVAKFVNTIGYCPLSMTTKYRVKVLRLNGTDPTHPSYPIALPLGLAWKKAAPNGAAGEFLEFLSTPEARAIMKENGAIPAL